MIAALRREIAGLPGVYWTVWLGTLVNRAGGFVVPFLALHVTRTLGHGAGAAGLVMSLYGAGGMLAGLLGGLAADRLGRRPTLLVSLFGGAAVLAALGFARSLPAVGALSFLFGLVGEAYRPVVSAVVADVVPPADRTRAYAHLYWVVNLGFAIAPALAGLCAGLGYGVLFAVDAITMAAYGIVVLLRVPETRPAEAAPGASSARLSDALADRTFVAFMVLVFLGALVMWQNGTALPLDMRQKGLGDATYGALMAENGLFIVLLQPPLQRVFARLDRGLGLALASVAFGVGFGGYALAHDVPTYAITIGIWSLGEIAMLPSLSAVVADLSPPALRGRYQGLSTMAWGGASCLGPLLGGAVLSVAPAGFLWAGCFGVMLASGVGYLALGPRLRARSE